MKNQDTHGHSSVAMLLNDIGRNELLSTEELNIQITKAQKGDLHARQMVIQANLRFIVSVAKHYYYSELLLGDLVNEGCLGLIKAIQHFDVTRGVSFISYASWWVRQKISNAVYNDSMIRLPMSCVRVISRIRNAHNNLMQEHVASNHNDTCDAIAAYLDMDTKNVGRYLNMAEPCLSLDTEYDTGEDFVRLQDSIPETTIPHPDAVAVLEDEKERLYEVMASVLNDREFTILCDRYGLGRVSKLTLKELSKKFQITNERVRQIELVAVKKIQKHYRAKEFLQMHQPTAVSV